jgi:hypothetical protein
LPFTGFDDETIGYCNSVVAVPFVASVLIHSSTPFESMKAFLV